MSSEVRLRKPPAGVNQAILRMSLRIRDIVVLRPDTNLGARRLKVFSDTVHLLSRWHESWACQAGGELTFDAAQPSRENLWYDFSPSRGC
jgi:hypothetical protein